MNRASNNLLPWSWTLGAGNARRIDATKAPRWLRVDDGHVWLTTTRRAAGDHPDVWLASGESVRLPSGSQWVIEGRGPARYTLMQEAAATSKPLALERARIDAQSIRERSLT